MKFSFLAADVTRARADLVILPLFDADLADRKKMPAPLKKADAATRGLLLKAAAAEGFKAKAEQSFVLHTHGKLRASRVVLMGLGARAKFDAETLRLLAGRAAKLSARLRAVDVVFALPSTREFDACVKAAAEGFVLGAYKFDKYRTTNREEKAAPKLGQVQLLLPESHPETKEMAVQLSLGVLVATATNNARNLVNEPAEDMTPSKLAGYAVALAEKAGLAVDVKGREEITALKMGMFLGVARGSVEEPKLIQVSYVPKDPAAAARKPLVFVGKAITFDSGGLSLKTADGMVDMKTDMAGSAAVLGAMQVVAKLKPPFPVHGLMGACENMPSGNAYRPGDVLRSRIGKTVEITNTDAEGRLVLGDVLAWATELKPHALVDLATLTGACVIALGNYITGLWGSDDPTAWAVLEAARGAGEEMWRMPLSDMQKDALRSDIADMKNSGERWGSSINAALFLKEFVGETPWVHLDIAGPSTSPRERGYFGKGATGVGVRTLVELVRRRTQELDMEAAPQPTR
ncbi:MAG: leucyl aminopeptidase [Deltaproteobacteria bacterium]|nr:leucyl aminopeptidase [Deltaproteobacteria bacterium]